MDWDSETGERWDNLHRRGSSSSAADKNLPNARVAVIGFSSCDFL